MYLCIHARGTDGGEIAGRHALLPEGTCIEEGLAWLAQYVRQRLSREEIELQDVEQQMEEELVQQHQCVERVVALKYDKEEKLRYLIKWKGLPYVECTWELTEDVVKAGGEAAIQDYKVCPPSQC